VQGSPASPRRERIETHFGTGYSSLAYLFSRLTEAGAD